ncbi:nicotinamide riboside transporter PnuC [Desmospora activa]|uniref:Nicotinamide mononucleotide transporter n=1 Tax=Desmospora activa DSM 45169 TaxID=1121389 RepID=A0A2T4Z841_9BACL|nr:nicotinamide riboside transporter PnuC [Desmospora activa]PTM58057.1 nicotinamide mononucleotide transporter [Desmospora activa DSM 45169]
MRLHRWRPFELIWLLSFSLISVALSIWWQDSLFGLTVFFTGVVCVVLAAKGSIWTYGFGVYNTLGYAWISYVGGLYGEMMLNAFFFFPMQIVGWLLWRNRMTQTAVKMRRLSWQGMLLLFVGCGIAVIAYGWWLSTLPGQHTPYLDAVTNVLSVIAMILMVLRFREQWALWIVINGVAITMWSLRLIDGSPDAGTMVVMWSAYLVNSVYGWIRWSKGAREGEPPVNKEEKAVGEG